MLKVCQIDLYLKIQTLHFNFTLSQSYPTHSFCIPNHRPTALQTIENVSLTLCDSRLSFHYISHSSWANIAHVAQRRLLTRCACMCWITGDTMQSITSLAELACIIHFHQHDDELHDVMRVQYLLDPQHRNSLLQLCSFMCACCWYLLTDYWTSSDT